MDRRFTLKRNGEFSRAYTKGKNLVHGSLVTYVFRRRKGRMRVGITTSKKIGGAVQRNRARRVIRAAFDGLPVDTSRPVDIVFVARSATTRLKMQKIQKVMEKQLSSAGLLLTEKEN